MNRYETSQLCLRSIYSVQQAKWTQEYHLEIWISKLLTQENAQLSYTAEKF